MKVRDLIAVSRPANGGLDIPALFELDDADRAIVDRYLRNLVPERLVPALAESAYRLAERGMPEWIRVLVERESHRIGFKLCHQIEDFPL